METLPIIKARGILQSALAHNIVEAQTGFHPTVLLKNPSLDSNYNLVMEITLTRDLKLFGYPELQKDTIETSVVFDYSDGEIYFPENILHMRWINTQYKHAARLAAEEIAEFLAAKPEVIILDGTYRCPECNFTEKHLQSCSHRKDME